MKKQRQMAPRDSLDDSRDIAMMKMQGNPLDGKPKREGEPATTYRVEPVVDSNRQPTNRRIALLNFNDEDDAHPKNGRNPADHPKLFPIVHPSDIRAEKGGHMWRSRHGDVIDSRRPYWDAKMG